MSGISSGPVLVGIDGSQSALAAVWWAAAEARSLRRPLLVVHATVWPLIGHPPPPAVLTDYRELLVAEGNRWLQQAVEVATEAAPEVDVRQELLTGDAGRVLLTRSADACEIVVGSRGLGGFTGMLVGSVAVVLAHHAQCPVVVVRGAGDPAGPVVVGVDGSPASHNAVGYAFSAAGRTGAPLTAVHTWSDVGVGELWGPPGSMLDWEAIREDQRRVLTEQLAPWQDKYSGVEVQAVVEQDRPAPVLREAGRNARLLVVGSRGRGGFTGLLLGSTSRALVHHAPCPLAVVRS
ncbi:MAG TPA: universal stress protein [Pseudonocardiaceae bacterium]|nr:universal stress protein [Pseudonocardiaceae bacterium]